MMTKKKLIEKLNDRIEVQQSLNEYYTIKLNECYRDPLSDFICPKMGLRAPNYVIKEFSGKERITVNGLEYVLDDCKNRKNYDLHITKVIHNETKRTTVVWFEDGSKIVVKPAKGVKSDVYTAVSYAISEKIYGSNSAFKRMVDNVCEKH